MSIPERLLDIYSGRDKKILATYLPPGDREKRIDYAVARLKNCKKLDKPIDPIYAVGEKSRADISLIYAAPTPPNKWKKECCLLS